MLGSEQRVELATLRINLRAIDADIEGIRRESRRYRQMNFALDIKEIQLTGLRDQREACAVRVAELERELGLRPRRPCQALCWLLLPLGIWLRLAEAIRPPERVPMPEGRVVSLPTTRATPYAAERERVAVGGGR